MRPLLPLALLGFLAGPAAAQPIIIPLSPQRAEPDAPPSPSPVPVAPPQAEPTDAPSSSDGQPAAPGAPAQSQAQPPAR